MSDNTTVVKEVDSPALVFDINNESVGCHFNETKFSGLVGFSHLEINFDYEGHFLVKKNGDYSSNIATTQSAIFLALGREAGLILSDDDDEEDLPLLGGEPPVKEPPISSGISCIDLLGDYENRRRRLRSNNKVQQQYYHHHHHHRETESKLKGLHDLFMLGLTTRPLDTVDTTRGKSIHKLLYFSYLLRSSYTHYLIFFYCCYYVVGVCIYLIV